MSKIEDALRRAQSERGQAPTGPPRTTQPRQGEHGRRPTRAQSRELVGLSAAEEIARMRDIQHRDPVFLARHRIIDQDHGDQRVTDAFRHLRTALLQHSDGRNFVLMVTSAGNDGGASFVAMNLAAAIAFDESKTAILVDCNLREPRFNDLLAPQTDAPGITDYLAGGETKVEDIIHPVGIPRLRLIPVGTRSAAATEHFTTPHLNTLLNELRDRYRERFLVIDTPPIMEAADARILAELCDYSLLVVPYGKVTQTQVGAAADALGRDRMIGCVMNNETRLPIWGQPRAAAS